MPPRQLVALRAPGRSNNDELRVPLCICFGNCRSRMLQFSVAKHMLHSARGVYLLDRWAPAARVIETSSWQIQTSQPVAQRPSSENDRSNSDEAIPRGARSKAPRHQTQSTEVFGASAMQQASPSQTWTRIPTYRPSPSTCKHLFGWFDHWIAWTSPTMSNLVMGRCSLFLHYLESMRRRRVILDNYYPGATRWSRRWHARTWLSELPCPLGGHAEIAAKLLPGGIGAHMGRPGWMNFA